MKIALFFSLVLGTLVVPTAPSYAGQGAGSGGDELRVLFEKARATAAARVEALKPCSFAADVSASVQFWILSHQAALASDIRGSQHNWITDPQATCAFTQTTAHAPITLSFVACKSDVITEQVAGEILTHESVHHFGFADEIYADVVARAVWSATLVDSCPDDSNDPFDPASCQGLPGGEEVLLPPGASSARIASFRVYSRHRPCNSITGCAPWAAMEAPLILHGAYGGAPAYDQTVAAFGDVSLAFMGVGNGHEELMVQFEGKQAQNAMGFGFNCPRNGGKCGWWGMGNSYYPAADSTFTAHCGRVKLAYRELYSTQEHWTERETILFSDFLGAHH